MTIIVKESVITLCSSDTYSENIFFILGKTAKFHTHSLIDWKVINENVAGRWFALH